MWDKVEVIKGHDVNVAKFVFKKKDAIAEAVLYKYPTYAERTVMCISVQSGCPMGCTFCGTGNRFIRNLTHNEIVYQIATMLSHTNIKPDKMNRWQIMFMSMGEPMLNYSNVKKVIKEVNLHYSRAELLISTAGPLSVHYGDLANLSIEIPNIGLQFSVHESTEEGRNKLVPFENKMTLKQMAMTGDYWNVKTGRKPFFNYCVHKNNNSLADIIRLKELFNPNIWEATISVICESDESVGQSIERQAELARVFCNNMVYHGYSTRVFNPAGQDDIGGGCGQLFQVQKWMKEREDVCEAGNGNR